MVKPHLIVTQILAWADAWHARTGTWPKFRSGPIPGAQSETWKSVNIALHAGIRGLPGGSSLARLLAEERGVRPYSRGPDWDVRQILEWADAHHARTGRWPRGHSGTIPGTGGVCWQQVDKSLRAGSRGLPGGSSLVRLLAEERGLRPWSRSGPVWDVQQILDWA